MKSFVLFVCVALSKLRLELESIISSLNLTS